MTYISKHMASILKRIQTTKLLPFFALWLSYFFLCTQGFGYPPESLTSVFFKILPIYYLCYYVKSDVTDSGIPTIKQLSEEPARFCIVAGLLVSSLGDACLVWRHTLFIPGLLFFAIAHMFYTFGFYTDMETIRGRTKTLFILLAMSVFLLFRTAIDSVIMQMLVCVYTALIFTMAWLATARFETLQTQPALEGMYGAFCFVFSDMVIAVDKWLFTVPFASPIIMCTYYLAQLLIALSATNVTGSSMQDKR